MSFKAEDLAYKDAVLKMPHLDCIHKSLNESINSEDEDYILRRIRDEYLSDSTVTIHLIGSWGAETRGWHEQRFIKRELQASLYDGSGNTRSGILGVVLPAAHLSVFGGTYACWECGGSHNHVAINDSTTIREFSYNYYIPHGRCSWSEADRYCLLASWDDFSADPTGLVEQAFAKRDEPIAERARVRP
ncbi:TIR domain-containing protein [Blastococcus sp. SYSU DS0619]